MKSISNVGSNCLHCFGECKVRTLDIPDVRQIRLLVKITRYGLYFKKCFNSLILLNEDITCTIYENKIDRVVPLILINCLYEGFRDTVLFNKWIFHKRLNDK